MNSFLLNRALGTISPQAFARSQNTRLLHAIQPASDVTFSVNGVAGLDPDPNEHGSAYGQPKAGLAHPAGVNAITVDKFEGRYLLSGGADSSVGIWDLEASDLNSENIVYKPLGYIPRTSTTANFGITHASFYPFDSLAFLTSSYDHTLKVFSSETLAASASFDLASVVYSHALSPVASHLLVACATQHPAVRLVDLRSGASTHSLAGHGGMVLTVSWHPKHEHVLASGGSDGAIRLWDIRRSASSLGVLDMDDSLGVTGRGGGMRARERGKAHNGPVNGLTWAESGHYMVSCGHDNRIWVWDTDTGANTLTNFGPAVRNSHPSKLTPVVTPTYLTGPERELLIFPNPRELLVYELHTGKFTSRLRTPSYAATHTTIGAGAGVRNVVNRTTDLTFRAHRVELYSAHTDGSIRCWKPRTWEDALNEDESEADGGDEDSQVKEQKRKRDELDDIISSLTKRKVTFT